MSHPRWALRCYEVPSGDFVIETRSRSRVQCHVAAAIFRMLDRTRWAKRRLGPGVPACIYRVERVTHPRTEGTATMKLNDVPCGSVVTIGHPANEILAVKGRSIWRYVESGATVDVDDFRAGWNLYVPGVTR